jgi:murein DD-endopeptidase MepM/ murein hydrolase activator NlpD
MAAIIEKQNVAKRRKTPVSGFSCTARHAGKSANSNTEFMSHFRQKPTQVRRKKTSIPNLFTRPPSKNRKNTETKTGGSGFSFPIPSIATMAVIAGTFLVAAAALNFEGIDIRKPDIYAIQLTENTELAEQRIIQYARTGVPSIFANINDIPQLNTPNGTSPENSSVSTDNNNHHGMLVTFEWNRYKVQRGDSVSSIAQRFGVSVGAIIASNDIRNARRLQEGAILRIPNIDGIPYQIQRGDSLSRISTSFNVPLEVILDVNDIKSDNIRPGETLFIPGARMNDIDLRMSLGELFMFPLPGRRHVTSNFGMRKDPISGVLQFHNGVDFRANVGTTVMASMDGIVSVVGENWLYGKYIIISHSNGYKTLYGHLNSFSVKQGDRVARGRKIGESGNTGYSTGPHLHFSIYDRNNRLVNPLELIN